jgi:hypothetical protein
MPYVAAGIPSQGMSRKCTVDRFNARLPHFQFRLGQMPRVPFNYARQNYPAKCFIAAGFRNHIPIREHIVIHHSRRVEIFKLQMIITVMQVLDFGHFALLFASEKNF